MFSTVMYAGDSFAGYVGMIETAKNVKCFETGASVKTEEKVSEIS